MIFCHVLQRIVEFFRVQKYHVSLIFKTINCSQKFSRQFSFFFSNRSRLSKFPRKLSKIIRRSKLTILRRRDNGFFDRVDSRNKPWHVSKDKLTNVRSTGVTSDEAANKRELSMFVLGYFLIFDASFQYNLNRFEIPLINLINNKNKKLKFRSFV